MNNKTLIIAIITLVLISLICISAKDNSEPEHNWVCGPFWISACNWWECPEYTNPSTLIQVEHCTKTGLIRLPKEYWNETSHTLSSSNIFPLDRSYLNFKFEDDSDINMGD